MKELSKEALDLICYIYKFKDGAFKAPFTASLFVQRGALGHTSVVTVKPLLEELKRAKLLKVPNLKSLFNKKVDRYVVNEKEATKFIEEYREEVEEEVYTQEYRDALEEEIKKYKRFVITTAVMGKEVNKDFLAAIDNYATRNNALKLVLPCEDVASRGKKAAPIELSPELKDFGVIFKDTYLNRNLCLCAVKVSAKQINTLTGLDRLTKSREASIIVASPKVFLKYVPNMHYEIPPAIMSTGAITVNDYDNDRYMSKRTSTLAENDHTYGAVIVEVEDEHIFHFRHVQADPLSSSITDLGVTYGSDGSVTRTIGAAMVVGDSHVGYHDRELHEKVMELAQEVDVKKVILHDIFHGSSISHHEAKKSITRAIRAQEGKLDLELECKAVKNYIEDIRDRGYEVVVPSANHNNHLLRYLEEGRYVDDPINLKFASKLISPAIDGINPLQFAIESIFGFKKDNVKWLKNDMSYKVHGVECSAHGDKGANGAKGNLATFEKGLGDCVVAHTHSAAIFRKVFCVGTVGEMDMGYNEGMSNWTRTCCLIYRDGTKQLINFIPNSKGDYSYTL